MAKLVNLHIYTPYRLFFSGPVEAVVADIADGQIGILADHTPIMAPLKTSILKILDPDGTWKAAAVAEGILEVTTEGIVILSAAAEWPEEINRERALEAKRQAEDHLQEEDLFVFDTLHTRARLERAKNRLALLELTQHSKSL
jgi:F-type H+-transporting ATPase subunit epsilon